MHKFNEEQIKFIQSLGLDFDFNNLTDEQYIEIEEKVGDYDIALAYEREDIKDTNSAEFKEYIKKASMCTSIFNLLAGVGEYKEE